MPDLDPDLRRRLERGEVETSAAEGRDGKKNARARALIGAPPDRVWDVITDYEGYKDFMPLTTVSRVDRREGDSVWFYTELDFKVKTIRYTIKLDLDRRPAEGRWHVDWTLIDGNLGSNEGSWHLEPYGDKADETFATYTVYIAPGFYVPGFVLSKLTQGSLPQLIDAVRTRVGDARYRR